ncbi:MAG: YceI family protein [Acidimicrobiales bacterium]
MKRGVVVGVVVGVLAVLAAGAWWLARPDAPPPLAVDDVAGASPGRGQGSVADLDGRWVVVPGTDTVAGLRIHEERAVGLGDNTAVGRTGKVTGSLVVADGQVSSGTFAVDLAAIEFTDDPGLPVANRSAYLRTDALETDRFPEARFELTRPVRLPARRSATLRRVRVVGNLELHGVARPMAIRVDVRFDGDRVVLATSRPVAVRLRDHGIEPPELRGLSKVADEGAFELLVVLGRR